MGLSEKFTFKKAVPVWVKNKELKKNYSLIFTKKLNIENEIKLSITAHSRYQLFVNGNFYCAGPARTAHGFYRVDEFIFSKEKFTENVEIKVIVAGYNVNSFYLLDLPSFFCAEVESDNKIIVATGSENDFDVEEYNERIQKVQRYSYQRPFTEAYDFSRKNEKTFITKVEDKNFIKRNSPYCDYVELPAEKIVSVCDVKKDNRGRKFTNRGFTKISDELKGFKIDELEFPVVNELLEYESFTKNSEEQNPENKIINDCESVVYDMGLNTSGHIKLSLEAEEDVVVYAVFNEVRDDKNLGLNPGRNGCANVVKWCLKGGKSYELISFEPYTYKFIEIIVKNSSVKVKKLSQIRELFPSESIVNLQKMPDEDLQKIYDAGVETFRQNTADIFMDCPSRERAGWLCDAFFTSQVEYALTGKNEVEHNFLENFLLPEKFDNIPDGALPMCYPSDHNAGEYIPNWIMWYVIELNGYFKRTNDKVLVEKAKEKVYGTVSFFKKYENKDGLLEKLDSWVFIEWSKANDFVQDINYPSNMLYCLYLDCVAKLYEDCALKEKADKLRKTIVEKSYDGEWFYDNAILDENGTAVRTNNHTETCQYYAFFTKTATKEKFPNLFEKMMKDFGPNRDDKTEYPDVPISNAFIGNYLRLQLLFEDGQNENVVEEIRNFFLPMAEITGTLWENMTDGASCNHGFASYVVKLLNVL